MHPNQDQDDLGQHEQEHPSDSIKITSLVNPLPEVVMQQDTNASQNSSASKAYDSTESWEKQDLSKWGPHKLPHIAGLDRRLTKSETYALIMSRANRSD